MEIVFYSRKREIIDKKMGGKNMKVTAGEIVFTHVFVNGLAGFGFDAVHGSTQNAYAV